MARVALLSADLLFSSKLEGALRAAGHDVARYGDPAAAGAQADVLIVDVEQFDPARLPDAGAARVGYYPHVQPELRERALAAGFETVVPRSRMARETVALVESAVG
jgi:hypothetical protein